MTMQAATTKENNRKGHGEWAMPLFAILKEKGGIFHDEKILNPLNI